MNRRKIMLVGGGSGGHLTPLIAVASAIKNLDSTIEVVHIGQKNENLHKVLKDSFIDTSYVITAGKFRRYHGVSFLSHILDFKTLLLNFRDMFRFIFGTVQAWRLLGKVRPDSIMLKGGFVCVPVGYAARFRRIPYITHDSDAVPGLANRLTARHAIYNTTALPAELYPYDQKKTVQVGIPLRDEFKRVTSEDMRLAKRELSIDPDRPVLFSVGGGLGAQRVNRALVAVVNELFEQNKNLVIMHITGNKLYEETKNLYESTLTKEQMASVKLIDFTSDLYRYSAAADVVLSRGGATNIAEFAAQSKACIIVPNPMLTGGQQLHNAEVLATAGAAIIVYEENLSSLGEVLIQQLNADIKERQALGERLHALAVSDSANKIAELLLEISLKREADEPAKK